MRIALLLISLVFLGNTVKSLAGVKSNAAREAAEYLIEKFGKDVGEKGVQTLTEEISVYGTRYGDEAIEAIRKAGPRTFNLIDDAGDNARVVIGLINRYGNNAVWVASKPRNLAIFVRYGDEAAKAMIKHPGIAAPAIEKLGIPAAGAIRNVSGQNARRIAMMVDDGSLVASGKASEILEVIGRSGDRAADWVWRHKGSLTVVAVTTAFLSDPKPFIDGTVEVVKVGGETFVRPVAAEAGKAINWNLFVLFAIVVTGVIASIWLGLYRRLPWNKSSPVKTLD
jgi:hypothetical protein